MTLKKNAVKTSSFFVKRFWHFPKTHPKRRELFRWKAMNLWRGDRNLWKTPMKNDGVDLWNSGSTKIYHGKWPKPWGIEVGKGCESSCFIKGTTFVNQATIHCMVNPVEISAGPNTSLYPFKSPPNKVAWIFQMIHASRRVADLKRQSLILDFLGQIFGRTKNVSDELAWTKKSAVFWGRLVCWFVVLAVFQLKFHPPTLWMKVNPSRSGVIEWPVWGDLDLMRICGDLEGNFSET